MKYLAVALIFLGAVGGTAALILAPQWPWLAFGIACLTLMTSIVRNLMKP